MCSIKPLFNCFIKLNHVQRALVNRALADIWCLAGVANFITDHAQCRLIEYAIFVSLVYSLLTKYLSIQNLFTGISKL